MITYDDDDDYAPSDYLDHLEQPPMSELWAAVREAHDYLHEWLYDPSTRVHPVYGKVVFKGGSWGAFFPYHDRGMPIPNECWVCLAGLRYLRKENSLLGVDVEQNGVDISATDYFLDALHDPITNSGYIEQWLGVRIPVGITSTELGIPDPESAEGILTFLTWLLQQRDTEHSNGGQDDS
jgi:hypothetical protein